MMNWQTFIDPEFSSRLCLTLLHSIWQVALIALLIWLTDRWLRNRSVGIKQVQRSYALHVLGLVAATVAMPMTFWLVDAKQQSATVSQANVQTDEVDALPLNAPLSNGLDESAVGQQYATNLLPAPTIMEEPPIPLVEMQATEPLIPLWYRFAPWLAVIYCVGVVLMLIRLAVSITAAHRLGAQATQIITGRPNEILNGLAEQWSLKVVPKLAAVEAAVIPQVVGLFRSTILLPASAISGLSSDELEMILAHELAHVRRHDMWVNLLQRLVEAVLFFNPALWFLSRRISALREYCCDELACEAVAEQTQQGEPRLRYAQALLRVVELKQDSARAEQVAALAASGRSPSELRHRVARLFGEPLREPIHISRGSICILAMTALLLLAGPTVWQANAASKTDSTEVGQDDEQVEVALGDDDRQSDKKAERESSDAARNTTWTVLINVVDESTGEPIANPRVGFRLEGRGEETTWQNGDENGRLSAKFPLHSAGTRVLKVRAEGHAAMQAAWRTGNNALLGELPGHFTFEMTKAVTVGGTIVDADGQPVVGATVSFAARAPAISSWPLIRHELGFETYTTDESGYLTYTTDNQGRWRCDIASPKIAKVLMNVGHPDFVSRRRARRVQDVAALLDLSHQVVLQRGIIISGHVVDDRRKPLAGVQVATNRFGLSDYSFGPLLAETDDQGRYQFKRIDPFPLGRKAFSSSGRTVRAIKPGYSPALESIAGFGDVPLGESPEDHRIVDFQMSAGAIARVKVVDSDGRPISGVLIRPLSWQGGNTLAPLSEIGAPDKTDEDGVWEWKWAPRGAEVEYEITKPGYVGILKHAITAKDSAEAVRFVLKRPQVIIGKVIDKQTRKPIQDFVVEKGFEDVNATPTGMAWASASAARQQGGTYRKEVFTEPHNGRYRYRALASGYEIAISESIPFKEGETTVDFELVPIYLSR